MAPLPQHQCAKVCSLRQLNECDRSIERPAGAGDIWTWVGLNVDTRLIASRYIDDRDSDAAIIFIDDLALRLASRAQLTGDGHKPYLDAPCAETQSPRNITKGGPGPLLN